MNWSGMSHIYYNPAHEDGLYTHIATAATDLASYLNQIVNASTFSVVTSNPSEKQVTLAVNASLLAGYKDDSFQLIIDSTNGVTITGKTPHAVSCGVYYFLEKLGWRDLAKSTVWTVIPATLITLTDSTSIIDPTYFWRDIATGLAGTWARHNKMLGAYSYRDYQGYSPILDLAVGWDTMDTAARTAYYNAHPTYFYPTGGYVAIWNLNLATPAVKTMAVDWAVNRYLNETWGSAPKLAWGVACISPLDNGTYDPPYVWTETQTITDIVFDDTNAVAAALLEAYPTKYVMVFNYLTYSSVPTATSLSPNLLVPVTAWFNFSTFTNYERVTALQAKGATVGWYDFVNYGNGPQFAYENVNIVKWCGLNGIKWYAGEYVDTWGGAGGLEYYCISKLLWDSTLELKDILADFYAKAFGAASSVMQSYYEVRDSDNAAMAKSYDYLSQAETLAVGDSASLARIRQIEDYTYFVWKYFNVGYLNLSTNDLKAFYTFCCNIRDTYLVDFSGTDPVGVELHLRNELINNRGLTSGQVDALQDFGLPTTGETASRLAEGISAFSGYLSDPVKIDPHTLVLGALGDTVTSPTTELYGKSRFILVYSAGNEDVTVSAKSDNSNGFSIQWFTPTGMMTGHWEQTGVHDWSNHNFPAVEAGYYYIRVSRGSPIVSQGVSVAIPNRPAAIIADPRTLLYRLEGDGDYDRGAMPWFSGTIEQYFYVPAGTTAFTLGNTLEYPDEPCGAVSGTMVDPNSGSHAINWTDAGETTITSPVAGLWKLTISNTHGTFLRITGIPPLIWHDPEYLLVEGEEVSAIVKIDSENIGLAEGITRRNKTIRRMVNKISSSYGY